ncbi:PfkB family carbohydrate kinase [Notoacmeibacter ruber]|uniref:Fructoselysine 6-kinase n=1 Tax=Notoacmeibacter ruber TaxID=2670375 RepID=A0A3L7JEU9_9HYPH|nr:PfkB family carbohydrate kinase [Notoacmeibacter ruber]RLQ87002.1 fructoselysine 6-kinase [Notoacmeibacter ruber]
MSPRFDLIAIGDNCIDRLSGLTEAILVGGNAVNVAIQAAQAGLRTAYAGAVGPEGEADGDRVADALAANGVNTGWLERVSLPTSISKLHIAPDGDRTILSEDFGACTGWTPSPDMMSAMTDARHIHIGWLNDGGAARRHLSKLGMSLSQDISVNALSADDIGVEGLSIAFASLPEDRAAEAQSRAQGLVESGAESAVITLGSRGSLALIDGQIFRAEAPSTKAIDTTGAGDSYIAGFLAARMNQSPIPEAMAAGHDRAARTCTHPGGFVQ